MNHYRRAHRYGTFERSDLPLTSVVLSSVFGAILAVFGLIALAGTILLLISDWGSDRANRRVRRVRLLALAVCGAVLLVVVVEIVRDGLGTI